MSVKLSDFKGDPQARHVYVIVFQEGQHLRKRLHRICDSFNGRRFELPDNGHGDKLSFRRKEEKI